MLMPRRFSKERQIILCDANHNTLCVPEALPRNEQRIRLLSFNIQVGISTSAYRHYVTRSWKHLLPHQERYRNLEKIGFYSTILTLLPCKKPMAGVCDQAILIKCSNWRSSATFRTGINNVTAT